MRGARICRTNTAGRARRREPGSARRRRNQSGAKEPLPGEQLDRKEPCASAHHVGPDRPDSTDAAADDARAALELVAEVARAGLEGDGARLVQAGVAGGRDPDRLDHVVADIVGDGATEVLPESEDRAVRSEEAAEGALETLLHLIELPVSIVAFGDRVLVKFL
jgi:hypothetical protein